MPSSPPRPPTPAPAAPTPAERRKSILIVDDEEVIRLVLRQLLVRDGHEIVEAANAEEAMRLITAREFDLLVTDKNLPGMDGVRLLELARKIRPEMRAILITGYPSEASAEASLRLGVMDYLTKPFDEVQVVRSKINAVLAAARRTPVVPRLPSVRPGRILVVETQTDAATRLVDMLQGLKAHGILAANLEQATKFAGDGYAGAIASWEAVPRPEDLLRLRELVAERPFVLVTAHISWDKILTAIRLGAKACLPKSSLTMEMLAKELAGALPA